MVRRLALALSFLLPLLFAGCPATENVLLLEVTTQADVDTLDVVVIDADGGRAGQLSVRVGRTLDDINNREPIRLVVPVGPGGPVTVFVRGVAPAGAGGTRLLATRCYVVSGPLRDDVLLVAIDSSLDSDGDGFPLQTEATCRDITAGGMAVACDIGVCPDSVAGDCDDENPGRFPGNDVICMNMMDENCRDDGLANGDEPCEDRDGDGWTGCGPDAVMGTCDCADDNPDRNPDAMETSIIGCNDMIDQNCDGTDERCDLDMDGFTADRLTGGAPDCDDTNAAVNPDAAEVCGDRIDNNCNRLIDEGAACAPDDLDRDGAVRCPPGPSPDCTTCDCDDCNGAVGPRARPICDGLDQLTGMPVSDCPLDTDGDGDVADDCDPMNRFAYTGAPENCSTPANEACVPSGICSMPDADMDGYVDSQDCDPANAMVSPGQAVEACDSVDNDCDGIVNELDASQAGMGVGCAFDPTLCGDTACTINYRLPVGPPFHCGGCAVDCNPDASNIIADQCVSGSCDCSTENDFAGACSAADTCCPLGCVNRQTDELNCGSCGVTCTATYGASPDCVSGSCVCEATGAVCPSGTPNCCNEADPGSPGCVDFRNDPNNCGSCGHECGAGASCVMGNCVCDSLDTRDCNGSFSMLTGDGCEAAINIPTRCGGCTTDCEALPNVATASCGGAPGSRTCGIVTCDPGYGDCDGLVGNGCETNLNATSTCGATCAGRVNCNMLPSVATATCTAGACGISACTSGRGNCDGSASNGCETNLNDPAACGTTCGGRIDCNSLANVNAVGCSAGACTISSCDAGWANCSGGVGDGCETDVYEAASCGTMCSGRVDCNALPNVTAGTCPAGACGIMTCDAGYRDCDTNVMNGCEVNTTSPTSCGSSCTTTDCTALPNVSMVGCASGSCTISSCDPGFADCGGGAANGCETDIWEPASCGTMCSGRVDCTALPNVDSVSCPAGTCTISSCDPGFGDCGAGAGCETNLNVTTACGTTCAGRVDCTALANVDVVTCGSGTCAITSCDPGFGDCSGGAANGCETNLYRDVSCGTTCGARINCTDRPNTTGGSCSSGTCTITCAAGFGDCNTDPSDGCETPLNTTSNCRACGTVCGGSDMCCPTGTACRPMCG